LDDYRIILDSVSSFPVMAILSVFDENGVIDDFFVEYLNRQCIEFMQSDLYWLKSDFNPSAAADRLSCSWKQVYEEKKVGYRSILSDCGLGEWQSLVLTLKDVTADQNRIYGYQH
jgi:hypothetical protein